MIPHHPMTMAWHILMIMPIPIRPTITIIPTIILIPIYLVDTTAIIPPG